MSEFITAPEDLISYFSTSPSGTKIGYAALMWPKPWHFGDYYIMKRMQEVCDKTVVLINNYNKTTPVSTIDDDTDPAEVLAYFQGSNLDLPCDVIYYDPTLMATDITPNALFELYDIKVPMKRYILLRDRFVMYRHKMYTKAITDLIRPGVEVHRFSSISRLLQSAKYFQMIDLVDEGVDIIKYYRKLSKYYLINDVRGPSGFLPTRMFDSLFVEDHTRTFTNPYKTSYNINKYNTLDDFKSEILASLETGLEAYFYSANFNYEDIFKEATYEDLLNGTLYVMVTAQKYWDRTLATFEYMDNLYFEGPGDGFLVNFTDNDCYELWPERKVIKNMFSSGMSNGIKSVIANAGANKKDTALEYMKTYEVV